MTDAKRQPTNRDLQELITRQHEEVTTRLVAVEEQVKYTNGRVKALETKAERADAVEVYKASEAARNPTTAVKVETSTTWDWKTVLAILLTLATAIAAIAGVGAK